MTRAPRRVPPVSPVLRVAIVVAVLLAGCAPLPTRDVVASHDEALKLARRVGGPPSTAGFAPQNATADQRHDTVERIWQTIEDYYYDASFTGIDLAALKARSETESAGVRSDAEFYRVLKHNVDAIHDSHTGVLTPAEAAEERTDAVTRIGIGYDVVDGRVVIDSVLPGFPADEAGVRSGMLIEAVDDVTIDAAFLARAATADEDDAADAADSVEVVRVRARQLRAVEGLLVAKDGVARPHRLSLRRLDDSMFSATVVARAGDVPTVERFAMLPSGVGVLRLSRFDPSILKLLQRDLDQAGTASRALVVDLRDNPGGDVAVFEWLLDRFIERPVALGTLVMRRWGRPVEETIEGEPAEHPYLKPVAVLVDGSTGSAAEWTAHALVELRGAIAVGEPTCGCVVGIRREFVLPDDGVLRVAEAGIRSPLGRRMENDPLVPSLVVRPALADLRRDDDVVLRAAEQRLLEITPCTGVGCGPAAVVH